MKYSKTHEWTKDMTIGITDWAQGELGEIVFIDTPKVGDLVKANDVLCVVETTKAATDIYVPYSGKITEINPILKDDPGLLNRDPEGHGWIAKVEPQDADLYEKELKSLLDASGYAELTHSQR
jgi:glycine cleavage system H protein